MKTALLLALLLALAGCASRLDVQGHRGARGLAPENTLHGFDVARAAGVTTLELDIGITRDGVPVIAHDPRLNPNFTRDEHGRWLEADGPAIRALTWAELQRYDVGRLKPGTPYAAAFAQQQPRDGARVPTLAALFERVAAAGDRAVRFNIETKLRPDAPNATADPATFVSALLDVVRAHGMTSRVTVQSFDWRTLRLVQREAPSVPTACLTARTVADDGRWTAGLRLSEHGSVPKLVKAAGCGTWSPPFAALTADALAEARGLGLKVVVWTVNEPADIERMLALGVDGIISDHPERVQQAVRARTMPDNAPR
jgi:glycerophosphoryl diester phosphodiesterase